MVEIFFEAPLELIIIIGGCLISGAWFMYREYKAEQKRKERHQKDLNESFKKAKLTLVKKLRTSLVRSMNPVRVARTGFFYACRGTKAGCVFGLFFDPTYPRRRKGS